MTASDRIVPLLVGVGFVSAALMLPDAAIAGSGGTEFDSIWDTLTDWVKGTLGKIIVLAMIIVGIVGGIARQSILAFAVGVGGGIGLFQSPDVIDQILSASVAARPEATGKALEIAPAIADVAAAGVHP